MLRAESATPRVACIDALCDVGASTLLSRILALGWASVANWRPGARACACGQDLDWGRRCPVTGRTCVDCVFAQQQR
eukprot:4976420-Pyramimonas_sp.AAC.1